MAVEVVDFDVRPPLASELEVVRDLRHRVLDPGRAGDFELSLGERDFDPSTIHVAAFDGNRVISTVRLDDLANRGLAGWYEIRKMATDPGYQKRGVGSAVMKAAELAALGRGASSFRLDARHGVIDFYNSLGYELTGETVEHSDEIPNFTMIKQV